MNIYTDNDNLLNKYEFESLIKTFYPISRFSKGDIDKNHIIINKDKDEINLSIKIGDDKIVKRDKFTDNKDEIMKFLYEALVEVTNYRPKWGMIIGVRPIKQVTRLKDENLSDREIVNYLKDRWDVSDDRAKLALQIAYTQSKYKNTDNKNVHLYISIPFCKSRCKYCSFVSQNIENEGYLIEGYISLLKDELKLTRDIIKEFGLNLKTIYIGGGTPTSINERAMLELMEFIKLSFNLYKLNEYTVEAGRVDSLNEEKLKIIHNNGAKRICLNPQTFTKEVLEEVKRPFDKEKFIKIYSLAQDIGFRCINMDFIAGLPKESVSSFLSSIKEGIKLNPQNITIHCLTLKRGSTLINEKVKSDDIEKMIEKSRELLKSEGYYPYYLYKQKNMTKSLENVGYAKGDIISEYNIRIMEEDEFVIGCGADSVSKIMDNNKLRRVYNFKHPNEYCKNFDEVINRKLEIKRLIEMTLKGEML